MNNNCTTTAQQLHTNKNIKKENKDNNSISPSPKTGFSRPTMEEVSGYCLERNNAVDAQRFMDYYESIGWKIGNKSMKDWRAAVRTWERNSNNKVVPIPVKKEEPEDPRKASWSFEQEAENKKVLAKLFSESGLEWENEQQGT